MDKDEFMQCLGVEVGRVQEDILNDVRNKIERLEILLDDKNYKIICEIFKNMI